MQNGEGEKKKGIVRENNAFLETEIEDGYLSFSLIGKVSSEIVLNVPF